MKRYANISNGLAYDHDDVCNFQSNHGHNARFGYFRMDAMPYSAVIELLHGREICIVDGTSSGNALTDALRFGLTTWALVFNRALRIYDVKVAPWQTKDMVRIANSRRHKTLVQTIRKIEKIYGNRGPVRIGPKELIHIECCRNVKFDDKPELLRSIIWINNRAQEVF